MLLYIDCNQIIDYAENHCRKYSVNCLIFWYFFFSWTVKNVPVYYNKTVEVSRPYVKVASEYAVKTFNEVQKAMSFIFSYIGEKLPFISQAVCFENILCTVLISYVHVLIRVLVR